MGNSSSGTLRSIITRGDLEALQRLQRIHSTVQDTHGRTGLDPFSAAITRKGDTPLILAVRRQHVDLVSALLAYGCDVNTQNCDGDTALDVALYKLVPDDGDILHYHFCPYTDPKLFPVHLPPIVTRLLEAGSKGGGLERLVLYVAKDCVATRELIAAIPDLDYAVNYRLVGLLLQMTVWFYQQDNLSELLHRGVDLIHFWDASFMPRIVPPSSVYPRIVTWSLREQGHYDLTKLAPSDDHVQRLKLAFAQDWRADWNDGLNPDAQFRAGLHLTPESAVTFVKAANHYNILERVMGDIMTYVPLSCNGPDLRHSDLIAYLAAAGYKFKPGEITHIGLKFLVDFTAYKEQLLVPQPLKQLSRLCIRRNLHHNVFHAMENLTCLPPTIKDYISLENGLVF